MPHLTGAGRHRWLASIGRARWLVPALLVLALLATLAPAELLLWRGSW